MINKYWGDVAQPPAQGDGKNDVAKEPSYVETVDNIVYFYGEVEQSTILELNRRIRDLDNSLYYKASMQQAEPPPIILHINSFGGSIFSGLAAMDNISKCRVPVITVVDGCCASAATLISIVGKERHIPRHSLMMIHQLSDVTWGNYHQLKDASFNWDKLMEMIRGIYSEYTKVPDSKLSEILDHDIWFDAPQCLEYGLVDKII